MNRGFFAGLLCAAVLLAVYCPMRAARAEEAYSRDVYIEGIGTLRYYAQNDLRWADSVYEPSKNELSRTMRSSGCGPTVAAMAIARQIPTEKLGLILAQESWPGRGFPYCACSVNEYHHSGEHTMRRPTDPEEIKAYLPVLIASFATGNNAERSLYRKSDTATAITLFPALSEVFELEYRPYPEWEDVFDALQKGDSVITSVTRGIFTRSSHYLFVAGVVGDEVYLLDPFVREEYPDDTAHLLIIVEPGVVKAKLKDISKLTLHHFYTMSRRPASEIDAPKENAE